MKLLIVDDEPYTREGLRDVAMQSDLPLARVVTAGSGEAALRDARAEPPDILLCDVRMPGMDGIELCRAVRALYPDCRILLMSGYSDRAYLRSALELKAVSFIDKPIDESILLDALCAAANEIEATKRDAADLMASRGETWARALLRGASPSDAAEGASGSDAPELPIAPREGDVCRCVLIRPALPCRAELHAHMTGMGLCGVSATDEDGCDAAFIWHRPGDTLNGLCGAIVGGDGARRVAVGRTVRRLGALPVSYAGARRALETLFYRPSLRVAYAAGDARAALDALPPLPEMGRGVNADAVIAHVEALRDALLDAPNTPPALVRTHYHALLGALLKGREGAVLAVLKESGRATLWDACARADALDALERLVMIALDGLRDTDGTAVASGESVAVSAARRYIHRHFQHESLQLRDIASDVHLTAGHLNARFKRETGHTLWQYITLCRINRARELLKDTDERVTDVARQVGYGDAYYFGQVFRRETGMSPGRYRRSG